MKSSHEWEKETWIEYRTNERWETEKGAGRHWPVPGCSPAPSYGLGRAEWLTAENWGGARARRRSQVLPGGRQVALPASSRQFRFCFLRHFRNISLSFVSGFFYCACLPTWNYRNSFFFFLKKKRARNVGREIV